MGGGGGEAADGWKRVAPWREEAGDAECDAVGEAVREGSRTKRGGGGGDGSR